MYKNFCNEKEPIAEVDEEQDEFELQAQRDKAEEEVSRSKPNDLKSWRGASL